jgi:CRISPR-associated endonuclease Cas1
MRKQRTAPLAVPLARGRVAVVDGYGVKLFIRRRHLVIEDGLGRDRRQCVHARATHGLSRVVVIGHEGFITLEAFRWLADLGIPLLQIDRDGRVLATTATGNADARLHRLQALAPFNGTGLDIARHLLRLKLAGQARVLQQLAPSRETGEAIRMCTEALEAAANQDELLAAERNAAANYWAAWTREPVRFRRSNARALPAHWTQFGQRTSPLTTAPRLAINPANALLNYLYAVLEAETRVACLTAGLDPTLGVLHVDYRSRDSFVLDLMEAGRPSVDAFILELLRSQVFTRNDFGETSRGICRILSPLSHRLTETADQWGEVIAPTVEAVIEQLASSPGSRVTETLTPLTRATRRRRLDAPKTRIVRLPAAPAATQPACKRCGEPVPRRSRVYCDDCLPHYQREQYAEAFHGSGLQAIERRKQEGRDPTHGEVAGQRRATSNVQRKSEVREWDDRYGKLTDLSAFEREILPLIRRVPLSRLVRETGLSLRYVSLIRRGERTPHPRHWEHLRAAGLDQSG